MRLLHPDSGAAAPDAARPRRGFTILEVVLAMGVLMIGISVILTLFTFGAGLARTAQLRADAAAMADVVVADLEEHFFPLLEDGTVGAPVTIVDRPVPGHAGLRYSAAAQPDPDPAPLPVQPPGLPPGEPYVYRVDVELHWSAGGRARGHRFSALLLREVPFGTRLRRAFVESDS